MENWIETLKQTGTGIKDNLTFFILAVAIIVVVYLLALLLEKIIEKKNAVNLRAAKLKTGRITTIAVFSSMSFVLMLVEIPLWFVPDFYKIDASEVPVMIGAFAMGPSAGVAIEGIKIILKVFIKGTSTAFVGDFANFVIGCMYVIPASFIYHLKKSKKNAIIGMCVGTLFMSLAGCLLNAYMLIPTFARLFHMPVEVIVSMGNAVNKHITSLGTFIFIGVFPFNIIKGVMILAVTTVLYKYVRKLI